MRHELVIFLSPSVNLERSNMAPGGKQTDRKPQVSVRHNHSHPLAGLQLNRRDYPAVTLVRPEVLRSLRHYLRAQSQGHYTIDRLEERGVERGSVRRSSLKGRERATVNQTNIGTVSKAALGKLVKDGVERLWAFPSA